MTSFPASLSNGEISLSPKLSDKLIETEAQYESRLVFGNQSVKAW